MTSYEPRALAARSAFDLHSLTDRNWHELSQGEQKRTQLACILWKEPDVLLIDEPTNHLDAHNRTVIIAALKRFKGIGVIVSHDRELLNTLCYQCLFFVGSTQEVYAGGYDTAHAQLLAQTQSIRKQKATLASRSASLDQELARLHTIQQGSKKKLSKLHLSHKDHDAKAKIDGARLSGKDASLGQKKLNLEHRLSKMQSEISALPVSKDYSGAIFFNDIAQPSRTLLHSELSDIPLPTGKKLFLPELVLRSSEKIGLMGCNGVGKTSLLNYFLEKGILKAQRFYYLRQEMDVNATQSLLKDFHELKAPDLSRCLQIIARLGSDATQILKSRSFSSGEVRKLAIALAIVRNLELLVLDEPTNHLDLASIQNLEQALAASNLALLLVSHDSFFIKAVCGAIWEIKKDPDGDSHLRC